MSKKNLNDNYSNYEDLKKRYNSLSTAYKILETENNALKQINAILDTEKKQWVQSKEMWEKIVQQSLNDSNTRSNSYLEENVLLKNENNELRKQIDGNNN